MKKSNYLLAIALGASTLTYAQVGIGTSSPSNALDIETTGPAIDINDTGGGDPEINFQISGTTTFSIGIDNSDSDKLKIGTTAPDASTSITIDASQNVGIGNTSPTAKLDVDGSAIFNESHAAVDFRVEGDTEANLLFVDGSADAVGIGTATPASLVEISSGTAGDAVLTIKADTDDNNEEDNPGIDFIQDGGSLTAFIQLEGTAATKSTGTLINALLIGSEGPDPAVQFVTNDTARMTIEPGGDVGIGNTNPTTTLDVGGAVLAKGSISAPSEALLELKASYSQFQITDTDDGTYFHHSYSGGKQVARYNSTSATPLVTWDGINLRVGINKISPAVALDVNGSIQYTGTIADVSDKRLKENFSSIDGVLNKIMKIKGLSYNMINDSLKTREYGVIAQDVQAVFPEMVTTVDPENGYLGVAYIQLIPVLLEATKEQQAIIEAQKMEIETQKAELGAKDEELDSKTSTNAEEIEALKAQVQQLLQLIQQQESAALGK